MKYTLAKFFSSSFCFSFLALACLSASLAHAAVQDATVATVNGVAIPQALLEQLVKSNSKDSPEIRLMLKDELINREVLLQEAQRLGLDKTAEAQAQLRLMQQKFLVELALNQKLTANPVTDQEIRADYDRQIKLIATQGEMLQYRPSLIVLQTESEAKEAIKLLQKKEQSFDKLAKKISVDSSKTAGGALGWLLPDQMNPSIANVLVNLSKNSVAKAPIQTSAGWVVLKLDDKRVFVAPDFEESKNKIRQALVQQRAAEYIRSLKDSANITH